MNAIKTFFDGCRAGAFINNPTEAHRGIRSVDGYKKVTAKEIRDLAGPVPSQVAEDAVDIILSLVVAVLEDMRQKSENIKRLSIMLREILGPIDFYLTNIESNASDKGTKKFKVHVSKGVIALLENGEKPDVIFEHKIPVTVLRDEMMQRCFTKEDVLNYLISNLKTVFITKDEDRVLNKLGLRDSIPVNRDRYAEACIAIHEKPVYFRRGHSTMEYIKRYA